jgi:hypothetical protein
MYLDESLLKKKPSEKPNETTEKEISQSIERKGNLSIILCYC